MNEEHAIKVYCNAIAGLIQKRFPLVLELSYPLPGIGYVGFVRDDYSVPGHLVQSEVRYYHPTLTYRDSALWLDCSGVYEKTERDEKIPLSEIPDPLRAEIFNHVEDLVRAIDKEHNRIKTKYATLNLAYYTAAGALRSTNSPLG